MRLDAHPLFFVHAFTFSNETINAVLNATPQPQAISETRGLSRRLLSSPNTYLASARQPDRAGTSRSRREGAEESEMPAVRFEPSLLGQRTETARDSCVSSLDVLPVVVRSPCFLLVES